MKRSRKPRRKSAHQELVNEADAWVRAIVLYRQGLACLKCGQVKPLQAAHILAKGSHPSIRYDPWNVIGLCLKCHLFWSHRDPVGFVDWINHLFPGRIECLKVAASTYRKIDLKELICVLKDIAKREAQLPATPRVPGRIKDSGIPF